MKKRKKCVKKICPKTSVTPYPSHICVAPNHNLTTKWCVRPILNFVKIRYFKGFGVINDWT